jgi:hypothetical protein
LCKEKKIGIETKKKVLNAVEKNRKLIASEIFRDPDLNHNHVGLTTIKQMLLDEGFKARKPVKVHYITDSNKINRVLWCKVRKQWTINRWNNLIFSDESLILA